MKFNSAKTPKTNLFFGWTQKKEKEKCVTSETHNKAAHKPLEMIDPGAFE